MFGEFGSKWNSNFFFFCVLLRRRVNGRGGWQMEYPVYGNESYGDEDATYGFRLQFLAKKIVNFSCSMSSNFSYTSSFQGECALWASMEIWLGILLEIAQAKPIIIIIFICNFWETMTSITHLITLNVRRRPYHHSVQGKRDPKPKWLPTGSNFSVSKTSVSPLVMSLMLEGLS